MGTLEKGDRLQAVGFRENQKGRKGEMAKWKRGKGDRLQAVGKREESETGRIEDRTLLLADSSVLSETTDSCLLLLLEPIRIPHLDAAFTKNRTKPAICSLPVVIVHEEHLVPWFDDPAEARVYS